MGWRFWRKGFGGGGEIMFMSWGMGIGEGDEDIGCK